MSEVPRVYCELPGPVPTSAPYLTQADPYDGSLPGADRMTQHAPDDTCRWVARHSVAVCGHRGHPGYTWDPTGKRWRENPRPGTAAELSEMPTALAQPEPPAPWDGP